MPISNPIPLRCYDSIPALCPMHCFSDLHRVTQMPKHGSSVCSTVPIPNRPSLPTSDDINRRLINGYLHPYSRKDHLHPARASLNQAISKIKRRSTGRSPPAALQRHSRCSYREMSSIRLLQGTDHCQEFGICLRFVTFSILLLMPLDLPLYRMAYTGAVFVCQYAFRSQSKKFWPPLPAQALTEWAFFFNLMELLDMLYCTVADNPCCGNCDPYWF
jgi:hypothetical protein